MFDSLKNKLKNIFKKAPEVKELDDAYETVSSTETAPEKAVENEPVKETPKERGLFGRIEESPSRIGIPKETLKEAPNEDPETEGVFEDEGEPQAEQKLSRKERARLAKTEKGKKSEKEFKNDMVGDSGKKVKEGSLDDLLWELEIALMEADVALPVAEEIKNGVRENLLGKKYSRSYSLEEVVELSLKDAIRNVLKLNEFDFDAWFEEHKKPAVVMFIGINGTGKTTVIAKIGNRLMKAGKTIVLAAGDTFRAGAIEQLSIHADNLGCKIVKHSPDSDPAAVAFDAIEHAKAKRRDAVLVDTAGRMQTNNNLLDEMKKIVRVAKPDLKVFVGDSLAGNDAVEQARIFDEAVGIDCVILTKIDADSKGGAALSIAHTIGKPIAFVCNGQEYGDIIKFDADWMVNRIFE
jgi:signal recognition particle-docking protein FtsY